MTTGFIYDVRFCDHKTGPGHPERPERLHAIVNRLRVEGHQDELRHLFFQPATLDAIYRVHDPGYVRRLCLACERGESFIDEQDSAICANSFEVAQLAAGGVLAAVDAVVAGQCRNAFCAVRPPGHHAEHNHSMGFCLFNNVAVAAEHLICVHGLKRIAIVDFDVHHGNGTQHTFEERRDVLFVSVHEDPSQLYPGTGFASETGCGEGNGFTVNLPVEPYSRDDKYRQLFDTQVVPALDAFEPQFLLVSAGFDACAQDPLAHIMLTPDAFGFMTQQLMAVADRHCSGRLVSMLEGGYHLENLGACVAQHTRVLKEVEASGE